MNPRLGAFDPHWPSVVLLVNGGYPAGQTTAVDHSLKKNAISLVNGAAYSDTIQSFNRTSILLDGTNDYLVTGASSDFSMASDFTIDIVLSISSSSDTRCICDSRSGGEGLAVYTSVGGDNKLNFASNVAVIGTSSSTIGTGFKRLRIVKSGTTLYGFVDGALYLTVTDSRTYAASTSFYFGSSLTPAQFSQVGLDSMRLTKGIARNTSAFTPTTLDNIFPTR